MYFWQNLIGLHLHWTVMFLIVTTTLLAVSHIAYRWIEQPARAALSVTLRRFTPVGAGSGEPPLRRSFRPAWLRPAHLTNARDASTRRRRSWNEDEEARRIAAKVAKLPELLRKP
jgi:hypothetical protein